MVKLWNWTYLSLNPVSASFELCDLDNSLELCYLGFLIYKMVNGIIIMITDVPELQWFYLQLLDFGAKVMHSVETIPQILNLDPLLVWQYAA